MGLKLSGSEEREYENVPEDTYLSNCVGIVDLGKQFNQTYKVWRRKGLFMWEIPDIRAQFEKDGDSFDLPRVVKRQFGLTTSKRGHLRPVLEGWRGKSFGVGEDIEIKEFLGKPALVQVVHNEVGDRVYDNIGTVGKLLKGMKAHPVETELLWFSFDEHETLESVEDVLQDFPPWYEWVVTMIRASQEYSNLAKRAAPEGVVVDNDDPPF